VSYAEAEGLVDFYSRCAAINLRRLARPEIKISPWWRDEIVTVLGNRQPARKASHPPSKANSTMNKLKKLIGKAALVATATAVLTAVVTLADGLGSGSGSGSCTKNFCSGTWSSGPPSQNGTYYWCCDAEDEVGCGSIYKDNEGNLWSSCRVPI